MPLLASLSTTDAVTRDPKAAAKSEGGGMGFATASQLWQGRR
ncbi:hypothetical protein ACYT69_12985 [Streptococcus pyogenes]